jgi:alpha-1,2-mannosyltransferase
LGAAICAAFGLYAWAVFILSFHHDGLIWPRVNAPGADFMVYYHGAERMLQGSAAAIFDGNRFTAELNAEFRHWLTGPLPLHPWIYPPNFLLLVAPLALTPFAWSYALFMAGTFALAASALLPGAGPYRLMLAGALLLAPASANNVLAGQNAFLSAALLIGGMRLIARRPAAGGLVLGLLAVKPQLALMLPVALAAARAWRALLWAAIAALALVLASVAAFGLAPWRQWLAFALDPANPLRHAWSALSLRWGDSVESAALMLGAAPRAALVAQVAAVLLAAACVFAAWRRDDALKLPVLLAATVFAAPHVGGYDALLAALAAALYCRHAFETGVRAYDFALAGFVWVAPLCGAPAQGPFGIAVPLASAALMLTATFRRSAAIEHVVA